LTSISLIVIDNIGKIKTKFYNNLKASKIVDFDFEMCESLEVCPSPEQKHKFG